MTRFAALLSTAVLGLGIAAIPTAAHATQTIDCSDGPGTITESTEDYVLVGDCSDVDVDASNVTIRMQSATRLRITGSNVRVTSSGPIGTLVLTDAVSTVIAPRTETAKVLSSNVKLRIDVIGGLLVKGANNTVRATKGDTAKVRGSNNRLTYDRLDALTVKGANNHAVVRKGRTSVAVHGPNNVVRVNRRA